MDGVMHVSPGITPLFESIIATIRAAGARPGAVRMLIVFSDGVSTFPGDMERQKQAIQAAKEAGVSVFPVLIQRSAAVLNPDASVSVLDPAARSPRTSALPGPLSTEASVQRFVRLAQETGGEATPAVSGNDVIARILKSLARRIEFDYVAGYYPVSSGKKEQHNVEIVLKAQDRGTVIGGRRIVVH
jgi:hypothetical protein